MNCVGERPVEVNHRAQPLPLGLCGVCRRWVPVGRSSAIHWLLYVHKATS